MKITFRALMASFAAAMLLVAGSATAGALKSKVSIDNAYQMYLSTANNVQGTLIDSGADWMTTFSHTEGGLVANQTYYLHIKATDAGGVAGFLGEFDLTGNSHYFYNGTSNLTTSKTNWWGNNSGFGSPYTAVTTWGTDGVGPWGDRPGIANSATWIWAGNNDTQNTAYFTTVIYAVPEPTSIALLGLGLLGLGFARRRSAKAK